MDAQYTAQRSINAYANVNVNVNDRARLQDHNPGQYAMKERCLGQLAASDPRRDLTRIKEMAAGKPLGRILKTMDEHTAYKDFLKRSGRAILWLLGDAGTGKTMSVISIVEHLTECTELGRPGAVYVMSYFFCQADLPAARTGTFVLHGLIYLLIEQNKKLVSYLLEAYERDGKDLFTGQNAFMNLWQLFVSMLREPTLGATFIIIDAIDECVEDGERLQRLINAQARFSPNVRWLLSSRLPPANGQPLNGLANITVVEFNSTLTFESTRLFLRHMASELLTKKNYDVKTKDVVCKALNENAQGTMLWAVLASRIINKVACEEAGAVVQTLPTGLRGLYSYLLQGIELLGQQKSEACRRLLATAVVARRPLSLKELRLLVDLPSNVTLDEGMISRLIESCWAFLRLQKGSVYVPQRPAGEFLRTSRLVFPEGLEQRHYTIFLQLLDSMSQTLSRDMCQLTKLDNRNGALNQPNTDALEPIKYACVHWIDHAISSVELPSLIRRLEEPLVPFFKEKLLNWIEAVVLLKALDQAVTGLQNLAKLFRGAERKELYEIVSDAYRFLISHRPKLEQDPLQVYTSALVFSPTGSLTRGQYQQSEPSWLTLKPLTNSGWDSGIVHFANRAREIRTMAFSPDGHRFAAGFDNGTVEVCDGETGVQIHRLKPEGGEPRLIVFSSDGGRLATVSGYSLVTVWDAKTGESIRTVDHDSLARHLTFSGDGRAIACTTVDDEFAQVIEIWVWDVETGESVNRWLNYEGEVSSVSLCNGNFRMCLTGPQNARIIDTRMTFGDTQLSFAPLMRIDDGNFDYSTLSHDGRQMACLFLYDHPTIKILNLDNSTYIHAFVDHETPVEKVRNPLMVFSPNGKLLVTSLRREDEPGTIGVWDTVNGAALHTIRPHQKIGNLYFQPDDQKLAVLLESKEISVRDLSLCPPPAGHIPKHADAVTSVTFSKYGDLVATTSRDGTVMVWETAEGSCCQTLRGHMESAVAAYFSENSQRLTSISRDGMMIIWDVDQGEPIRMIQDDKSKTCKNGHSFSADGRVVALRVKSGVRIWDMDSNNCFEPIGSSGRAFKTTTFSPGGRYMATGTKSGEIETWDVGAGIRVAEMKDDFGYPTGKVTGLLYSADGKILVASMMLEQTIKLWDVPTGSCLRTILNVPAFTLSLNPTNRDLLNTDTGSLDIDLGDLGALPKVSLLRQSCNYQGYRLDRDKHLVLKDDKPVLSFAGEFSTLATTVRDSIAVISHKSGAVSIVRFDTTVLDQW
ncbi:Vegetative incompatibility HET-E-1-like protein [Cladobotryum mycophilum]|uniref:Vegetative incompatibility HET-E-1-like protein n=1 Tax=Cladobotryum mycophilum TaxID=491253 RepID=A0ABR0T3N3_9HYPO